MDELQSGELPLKAVTKAALDNMPAWTALFETYAAHVKPTLHIYVDGSWDADRGLGGFAFAIFLEFAGVWSFFGICGDGTHGHEKTLTWSVEGPQALVNEQIAMATALLWGATTPSSQLMVTIRNLRHFVVAIFGKEPSYEHVTAHQGERLNELVDVAAKHVARHGQGLPKPPAKVCHLLLATDLTWLAASIDPLWQKVLPVNTTCIQWQPQEDFGPSPLTPEQLILTKTPPPCKGTSAVVEAIFEDQLDSPSINIAFLQETKASEGLCQSARGPDGNGRPWIPTAADIKTIVSQPRLLVLLVHKDAYKVLVISGHCPHDARFDEAQGFMLELASAVEPYKRAHLILAGFDLNGRPPTRVTGTTGTVEYGEPDRIGHLAAQAFEGLGMWLPSTFPQLHSGQHATYCAPLGTLHRIDFVSVGGAAVYKDVASEVSTTFDTGAQLHRPKFDLDKLMSDEGRRTMAEELKKFQHPSWECHPDLHCQQIQDHVTDIMTRCFPLPERRPRASFIPQDTWKLRDRKLSLKRCARHRRCLWTDLLHRAFLQWSQTADYAVEALVAKEGLLYQLSAMAISFATHRIKTQIQEGKSQFLLDLAGDPGRPAGTILRQAKAAGAGGSKARPVARPLPQLRFKDGMIAGTRQDRGDLWTEHFGAQELGSLIDTAAYLAQPQLPPHQDVLLEWQQDHVPSIVELETAFRAAPRRKSPGLDNICGEMLLAAPAEPAKMWWPLFIKATTRICQPVQWRGDILHEAYKRSGCSWDPQFFRSLFVSSTVGKCFHKVFHTKSQQALDEAFHSFHLGARKNCPVTLPALYIVGHARRGRELRRSIATLYLDTEAAYYRVIRQLAFGNLTCDDEVIRVFQHFGLEPEEMADMMQQITTGGMAADTKLPPTTRHNIKDFHNRAWFVTACANGLRCLVKF
ncbi:unnamed protein product [Symbiodinium sp. CCMP2592]|nr:unnamed protein product [Symbiodinium sp. CCMP2592]